MSTITDTNGATTATRHLKQTVAMNAPLPYMISMDTSTLVLSMAPGRQGGNEIPGTTDRIVSCLPYLLPLLDGDRYGRFIFALVPFLGTVDAIVLGPFHLLYTAIPFGQFLAFIGLSILSRNPNISRPVRYNMQQALLLDILLIFPSLLGRLAGIGGSMMLPRILVESGSNFIFYVLVATVGYSLFSNLTGKIPNQIPIVSDATEAQIGPF